MRSYARQRGIPYEELAYYSGWHEEFPSVVGRIEREHPREYVDHAYGSVGSGRRILPGRWEQAVRHGGVPRRCPSRSA